MIRREGGGNGGKGRRVYRNNDKGHMDNKKWGVEMGEEVGMAGVVGRHRGKRQKTVFE